MRHNASVSHHILSIRIILHVSVFGELKLARYWKEKMWKLNPDHGKDNRNQSQKYWTQNQNRNQTQGQSHNYGYGQTTANTKSTQKVNKGSNGNPTNRKTTQNTSLFKSSQNFRFYSDYLRFIFLFSGNIY